MKFTIGTVSDSLEFGEDLKLIKSSLLYADEVELIGMAEYAAYKYIPRCLNNARDIDGLMGSFIPLLESIDTQEAQDLVVTLKNLYAQIAPYMSYLKKKRNRTPQEIMAQEIVASVLEQCRKSLAMAFQDLLKYPSTKSIQELIEQNIISVYDYKFEGFDIDELSGGYFANLLGTIKHGRSYPLFDNLSSGVVGAVVDEKKLDLSNKNQEVLRHAGISTNILMTLPTIDSASVDEILDFKKDMKVPLDNFRKAVYSFSEKITSLPWDDDFEYDCLKLYNTEVLPCVNEINELSSETNVLKNFGSKVLADEEARKKLGYIGAGLATTITTGHNITFALDILETLIRTGAKIGLSAAGVSAFLKTADLMNKAVKESKEKKDEIRNNVMYYYYKASKKLQ